LAAAKKLRQERSSFLKKRSKKLFYRQVGLGNGSATANKSFLVRAGRAPPFSKKNIFLSVNKLAAIHRQQGPSDKTIGRVA